MSLIPTHFYGGSTGEWKVAELRTVTGEPLVPVERLCVRAGSETIPAGARWWLRGLTSNERYVYHGERESLRRQSAALGLVGSSCAALIPVRKSAAWWEMSQERRREIFESGLAHDTAGLPHLPAVARRLYQCRDLGEEFDFITWFEYAPCDHASFEELVNELRNTEEWSYVDREIDIRLHAAEPATSPISPTG